MSINFSQQNRRRTILSQRLDGLLTTHLEYLFERTLRLTFQLFDCRAGCPHGTG